MGIMEKRQKPSLHTNWIDPEATFIVDRLQKAGFTTYLVGGCVRDLLAGLHPKDYDIATSASPEQVRKLIRGSYIIGKRFPLVLVKRGQRQFEVATFRRNALPEEIEGSDQSFVDNFYGTPQEDAHRRDFTVNGLFYDPIRDELIDYVEGIKDIESGFIRMIGDPDHRLKEDPIRILRAIRLSHKLRFSIEESLRVAIERNSQELTRSILPRKREEYFKLLRLDDPSLVFKELHDLNILTHILPSLAELWEQADNEAILTHYLSRTHELSIDKTNTTQLMLPLVLALSKIGISQQKRFTPNVVADNSPADAPENNESLRSVLKLEESAGGEESGHEVVSYFEDDEMPLEEGEQVNAKESMSVSEPVDGTVDGTVDGLTDGSAKEPADGPAQTRAKQSKTTMNQLVENLFKLEWGLFRTEQQSLYEALDLLQQMQPIENLLRKGHRRLRNFFNRDNTHLALLMAKADYLFTGEQWLKIEKLRKELAGSEPKR